MKAALRISLALAGTFWSLSAQASPVGSLEVSHVEGTTVHFKVPEGMSLPQSLTTSLHDLKHLGTLESPEGGSPYLLFSGRPCLSCPLDKSLYMLRPDGGKPVQFVYPGKVIDPKSGSLILESRAFFGKCLPSTNEDVYVVFQKERVDRRRYLQSSVFVARMGKYRIHESLMERRLPKISATLKRVRQKQCREIEGRNRRMMAKFKDIGELEDAIDPAEVDDTPKENQTDSELPPAVQ